MDYDPSCDSKEQHNPHNSSNPSKKSYKPSDIAYSPHDPKHSNVSSYKHNYSYPNTTTEHCRKLNETLHKKYKREENQFSDEFPKQH